MKTSNFKGHKHSAETKEKIRQSKLGKPAWNKGRLCPKCHKAFDGAKRGYPLTIKGL